jgi:uncharacterized protein
VVSVGVRRLALASLVMIPVGVYTTFVEPFRLQLETADVPIAAVRSGRSEFTIGVLADIQTTHVGGYEWEAVDRLMACKPDVILIPGDIFQGRDEAFERELVGLRELFSYISAPGGVFVVIGNVDWDGRIERIIAGSSAKFLVNEAVQTTVGDRRLTIVGVGLDRTAESRGVIGEMERLGGDDDIRILLSHRPDHVLDVVADSRIDLVVSGHTHGGQVQIPFYGPPIILSEVPRAVGAGGLHDLDGRRIYVSRGIGWEHGQAPRIRFLCPPEISLLRVGG